MSHRSLTYHQHNENKKYRNIDHSAKAWKDDILGDNEFNALGNVVGGKGDVDQENYSSIFFP